MTLLLFVVWWVAFGFLAARWIVQMDKRIHADAPSRRGWRVDNNGDARVVLFAAIFGGWVFFSMVFAVWVVSNVQRVVTRVTSGDSLLRFTKFMVGDNE